MPFPLIPLPNKEATGKLYVIQKTTAGKSYLKFPLIPLPNKEATF